MSQAIQSSGQNDIPVVAAAVQLRKSMKSMRKTVGKLLPGGLTHPCHHGVSSDGHAWATRGPCVGHAWSTRGPRVVGVPPKKHTSIKDAHVFGAQRVFQHRTLTCFLEETWTDLGTPSNPETTAGEKSISWAFVGWRRGSGGGNVGVGIWGQERSSTRMSI